MLSQTRMVQSNDPVQNENQYMAVTQRQGGFRQHSHPTILLEGKLSEGRGGVPRNSSFQCAIMENQHMF